MAVYRGEVGLQFTTHLAKHYTVPQWVELAEYAQRNGFSQLWINDNLGHRNIFVLLTAIAAKVPIKLGTAILVPYFRNPIDTADAFASLSELMGGREISVGIARGDYAQAGNQIHMIKPIGMVKETVECLKSLLRGDRFNTPTIRCCRSFSIYGQSRASNWALPHNRRFYFIAAATDRELWKSPAVSWTAFSSAAFLYPWCEAASSPLCWRKPSAGEWMPVAKRL